MREIPSLLAARRLATALAVLAIAPISFLGATAQAAPAQQTVALFTHKAPLSQEYVLHGTLPIPQGTWNGNPNQPTLMIQDSDGTLVPTQMEIVTRSSGGNPDVVELIAKVRRPVNSNPGDRLEYPVVVQTGTSAPHSLHPAVDQLLGGVGDLVMRTRDVFGNNYEADILRDWHINNTRMLKDGQWLQQRAGHEVLLPTAGHDPVTALPHAHGVHAYVTTWKDAPYVALDLVVHNAMNDLDEETPIDDLLNDLYFRHLDLDVPVGWKVIPLFPNPTEGPLRAGATPDVNTFSLIEGLPQGKLHLMPRQSRFTRRYMLVLDEREALARAQEVADRADLVTLARPRRLAHLARWSWWSRSTPYYFPQKFPLPVLTDFNLADLNGRLEYQLDTIRQQIASGSTGIYPFTSAAMGWCHPWSEPYGGEPGGSEIYHVDGVRTLVTENVAGYRVAEMTAKSYMERQPMAFYGPDGDPIMLRDLMQVAPNGEFFADIHFQLVTSGVNGYPRFDLVDKTHEQMVRWFNLQPDYENQLREWRCVDIQHLIRYTRTYKILTWLGNDSLAKDELRLVAEIYRLSFHELRSSYDGYVQGSGLLARYLAVQENPGEGVGVGRGEAWGMDAACAAYAIGDDEFRARFRPWFDIFTDVLDLGRSSCTGNVMSLLIYNYLNGQYFMRQAFEVAKLEQSMRSIGETVYREIDPVRYRLLQEIQEGSTYSSMHPPFYSEVNRGPWFTTATGSRWPELVPDLCVNVPDDARLPHVDLSDYWDAIAYTYYNTQDPFLLGRLQDMLDQAQLVLGSDQLNYQLRLEARAAMIQLMETPLPQ